MVKWDPQDYARHSAAQFGWAQDLIARLHLRGDESLLDIGCGDGRVTAELAARLPRGQAVGIDSSAEMVSLARQQFPTSRHPNLDFVQMDARAVVFVERFDVAFSSAALHWVIDHGPVLRGVRSALRPRGRLLFQMGGRGNAAGVLVIMDELIRRPPWEPFFGAFSFPYGFYGPEEYEPWLRACGLAPRRVELLPKDMIQPDRAGLAGWVRTTWLPYTERVPAAERETFIEAVVDGFARAHPPDGQGRLHVAMVRLEVEAEAEIIAG